MLGWCQAYLQMRRKQIPSAGHVNPLLEKCNYYKKNHRKRRLGTEQHLFLITAWCNLHTFLKQLQPFPAKAPL